jgi:hypothetical protein
MYESKYKQCSAKSELHSMVGIMTPFVNNPDYCVVPVACSTVHMIFVISCVGILYRGSKVSTLRPTGSA